MSKKLSRDEETVKTRASETRLHEMRDHYDMEYSSPLRVPDSLKKDGYVYRWVNTGIRGRETYRLDEMVSKGWALVPKDRSSGLCFDPLGRNPLSKQYICYKDVILMERPKTFSDRERQNLYKKNDDKIRSLRGVSNDIGRPNTTLIDSF